MIVKNKPLSCRAIRQPSTYIYHYVHVFKFKQNCVHATCAPNSALTKQNHEVVYLAIDEKQQEHILFIMIWY